MIYYDIFLFIMLHIDVMAKNNVNMNTLLVVILSVTIFAPIWSCPHLFKLK